MKVVTGENQQHDEYAAIFAAMRADKRLEAGNMNGWAVVWLRIVKATEDLLSTAGPDHDAVVH